MAVILLAGEFAVNKLYQKKYGTAVETGLKFNALSGLFSALIFFFGKRFQIYFFDVFYANGVNSVFKRYEL